jgi:hypothetical protein
MAAQVLGGSGNVSYTNSTGQNVRLVINYLRVGDNGATMSFQGVTQSVSGNYTYGKTLAYRSGSGGNDRWNSDMASQHGGANANARLPLEIALSNGETFSLTSSPSSAIEGYNIIIIPEAG